MTRPTDIDALLRQAATALRRGDAPAATRSVDRALAAAPDHAAAHHMRGALYLHEERAAEAIPHLRRAVESGAGAGALANLGIALASAGEAAEAEEVLRRAAEAAPANPQVAYNLGRLLRQAGRTDEAEPWLRRATELAPSYVRAWCELGALLLDQGLEDDAASCFGAALAQEPDNPTALYNRALVDQRGGRFAAACEAYTRCRGRLGPARGLMLGYGACLQELGRVDDALAVYRELLATDREAYAFVLRNLTTASKGMFHARPSRLRAVLGL